jgi:hypothetical protein
MREFTSGDATEELVPKIVSLHLPPRPQRPWRDEANWSTCGLSNDILMVGNDETKPAVLNTLEHIRHLATPVAKEGLESRSNRLLDVQKKSIASSLPAIFSPLVLSFNFCVYALEHPVCGSKQSEEFQRGKTYSGDQGLRIDLYPSCSKSFWIRITAPLSAYGPTATR